MKKFILLFAAAASLFAACNKSDSDTAKPTNSAFVGTFTGFYATTSSPTNPTQPATAVVTDNPDGTVHVVLTVDAATANLNATVNAVKLAFSQQSLFGANATGNGDMPSTDQLHLIFTSTASGSGSTGQAAITEFVGSR